MQMQLQGMFGHTRDRHRTNLDETADPVNAGKGRGEGRYIHVIW